MDLSLTYLDEVLVVIVGAVIAAAASGYGYLITRINKLQEALTFAQAEITKLQTEMGTRRVEHEKERDELFRLRREDAVLIREQGDFIDALQNHIWEGKGPPPPSRPQGV
ncbi:MAG: hypothetical protein LBN10_03340 [Propionibacteriaceae bacterium]|jgi:hypothetical protein|nr:hypothetical protein [Propionibacteriaceae bacterium]